MLIECWVAFKLLDKVFNIRGFSIRVFALVRARFVFFLVCAIGSGGSLGRFGSEC